MCKNYGLKSKSVPILEAMIMLHLQITSTLKLALRGLVFDNFYENGTNWLSTKTSEYTTIFAEPMITNGLEPSHKYVACSISENMFQVLFLEENGNKMGMRS